MFSSCCCCCSPHVCARATWTMSPTTARDDSGTYSNLTPHSFILVGLYSRSRCSSFETLGSDSDHLNDLLCINDLKHFPMHLHDALYKCLNILAENEVEEEEEEEEQPGIGTFARSRCLQVRSPLSSDHLALPGHCHRKVGSLELHL